MLVLSSLVVPATIAEPESPIRVEAEARARDAGPCGGGETMMTVDWSSPDNGEALFFPQAGCWAEWSVEFPRIVSAVAFRAFPPTGGWSGVQECARWVIHVDGRFVGASSNHCGPPEGAVEWTTFEMGDLALPGGRHIVRVTVENPVGPVFANELLDWIEFVPSRVHESRELPPVGPLLVPAVPLPPAAVPGTPGLETPDPAPVAIPVATVAGRSAGALYCVTVTPNGGAGLNVACVNTLGVPLAPFGPVEIVRTPSSTPDVPPTAGVSEGAAGHSPALSVVVRGSYTWRSDVVVSVVEVGDGIAAVHLPADDSAWLLSHGKTVPLILTIEASADGRAVPLLPAEILVPGFGQVLGALHASSVGGVPLLGP